MAKRHRPKEWARLLPVFQAESDRHVSPVQEYKEGKLGKIPPALGMEACFHDKSRKMSTAAERDGESDGVTSHRNHIEKDETDGAGRMEKRDGIAAGECCLTC